MWYECLPPLIIISVLVVVPDYVSPYIKQMVNGTKYIRSYSTHMEQCMLARDVHQSKDWYNFKGLDSLPDK